MRFKYLIPHNAYHICIVILLAVGGLSWHTSALAALNDSGQTVCYDSSTMSAVACDDAHAGDAGANPRQDARFGRDAAQAAGALPTKTGGGDAGFDFSKICNDGSDCTAQTSPGTGPNEWGCTRDNVTGLLWEMKTATGSSPRDKDQGYTWYDSTAPNPGSQGNTSSCSNTLDGANCNSENYVNYINTAQLCGFNNGWRLPTRRELLSIVDYGRSDPAIDSGYFPNTQGIGGYFWTSESNTTFPERAWYVHFAAGQSVFHDKTRSETNIRLVRGAMPSSSFHNNGDGTISDASTGLMWDQCAIGQPRPDCANASAATSFTWQEALEAVVTSNKEEHLGYNDWRLPNIKELESLVALDRAYPSPYIDDSVFPNAPASPFWSSTTIALPVFESINGSYVSFEGGSVDFYNYSLGMKTRLVRGGQTFASFDSLDINQAILNAVADSPTSGVLTVTVDRDSTGYWLVLPAGSPEPTIAELAAGSSGSLSANVAARFNLTGLVANTAYDVWFTARVGSDYSAIQQTEFSTPDAPTPPPIPPLSPDSSHAITFSDGDYLHYGILYFAPAGSPSFCLGDDVLNISVQVTVDKVPYRITARLRNTCLQVFPTGVGSERALIIEHGTADITSSSSGVPLLLARNGDRVIGNDAEAIIRATVDPLCTSTRVVSLLGRITAPDWILAQEPPTGCPADALTPMQTSYIVNNGALGCNPAALTLKGTYAQLTIRWNQWLGNNQSFYVAAAVPGIAWFEDSVQNGEGPYWRVLQNFDPYAVVTTEGPLYASLFEGADMRYLTGSEIYVGYGQDLNDMLASRRYCAIVRIASPAH